MSSEACPFCGKKGLKNLKMHLRYCDKQPLEEVARDDADARFEERAKEAETVKDERVARAGRRRDFMPYPSPRNRKFPTCAWYLRPNGALPEDAFVTSSAWSANQREEMAQKGFIEVTPCKAFLLRREDNSVMGGIVMLDPPPKERWERIIKILEARRPQALAFDEERLAAEKAVSADGLTPAERYASMSRIRVYGARVEALSQPFDSDKLYEFFVEEARLSRRDQSPDAAVRRMVDARVEELVGVDLE